MPFLFQSSVFFGILDGKFWKKHQIPTKLPKVFRVLLQKVGWNAAQLELFYTFFLRQITKKFNKETLYVRISEAINCNTSSYFVVMNYLIMRYWFYFSGLCIKTISRRKYQLVVDVIYSYTVDIVCAKKIGTIGVG